MLKDRFSDFVAIYETCCSLFMFADFPMTTEKTKTRDPDIHIKATITVVIVVCVIILFGATAVVFTQTSLFRDLLNTQTPVYHSTDHPPRTLHWRTDNMQRSFGNSFTGPQQNSYRFYSEYGNNHALLRDIN